MIGGLVQHHPSSRLLACRALLRHLAYPTRAPCLSSPMFTSDGRAPCGKAGKYICICTERDEVEMESRMMLWYNIGASTIISLYGAVLEDEK